LSNLKQNNKKLVKFSEYLELKSKFYICLLN
jgi:hypothetical protein